MGNSSKREGAQRTQAHEKMLAGEQRVGEDELEERLSCPRRLALFPIAKRVGSRVPFGDYFEFTICDAVLNKSPSN